MLVTRTDFCLHFSFQSTICCCAYTCKSFSETFFTSSRWDGSLWNPFRFLTSQIVSKCLVALLRWGNSLEWVKMLSFGWKPEQVALVSLLTSSTNSSSAMLWFLPQLISIDLFHTKRSVCSLGRLLLRGQSGTRALTSSEVLCFLFVLLYIWV